MHFKLMTRMIMLTTGPAFKLLAGQVRTRMRPPGPAGPAALRQASLTRRAGLTLRSLSQRRSGCRRRRAAIAAGRCTGRACESLQI